MTEVGKDHFTNTLWQNRTVSDFRIIDDIVIIDDNALQRGNNYLIKSVTANEIQLASVANSIVFDNCHIKKILMDRRLLIESFEIRNSKVDELHILTSNHLPKITFSDNNIGEIKINGLKSNEVVFANNRCKFIKFKETKFDLLEISTVDSDDDQNAKAKYLINEISFIGNISNTIRLSNLSLEKIGFIGAAIPSIKIDHIQSNVIVSDAKTSIGNISINSSQVTKELFLIGGVGSLTITNTKIPTATFKATTQIHIKDNCDINDLNLESSITGPCHIDRTTIASLNINKRSIAGGSFILTNSTIKELFSIESASIEKGKITNVDLSTATIRVKNGNLSGVELINVRWNDYQIYEYKDEIKKKPLKDKLDILWALKECYRQLKVLSLAQHNKVDYLYFQKQELKIFWLITRINTRHNFWRNIGNWLILGSNKLFSDFGQNIWRPLIALFLCHLIFFNLFLYCQVGISPSFVNVDCELTKEVGKAYFVTVLPTHSSKIDIGSIKDIVIGGGWDFVMRILSGYFIFYFIYSSRKFHQ